ncbi:MAG: hypothetical protein WDM77_01765 [Steroidobacteraceae bacterium]
MCLGCGVGRSFAQTYTAVALPGLGGAHTIVTGLNRTGLVVGYSTNATYGVHAASWSGGSVTDLGTLAGSLSYALAVSDAGMVAGYSSTMPGDAPRHAILWSAGAPLDLGTLGGKMSCAFAINASGQVAGVSNTTAGGSIHYTHATLWNGTMAIDLGTLGAVSGSARGSSALGINASGQVVGVSDVAAGTAQHATLWTGTQATDLGTLGGSSSAAYAINASGQVVGQSDTAGNAAIHAASWSGARASDLGTLGGDSSSAVAINTTGQIVGSSTTLANAQRATAWSAGRIIDLNTVVSPALPAYITLTAATGINDSGEIAVYGDNAQTGGTNAFLLMPN